MKRFLILFIISTKILSCTMLLLHFLRAIFIHYGLCIKTTLYKYAFADNKRKTSKKRYTCSLFEKCQIFNRELALLNLRSGISQ